VSDAVANSRLPNRRKIDASLTKVSVRARHDGRAAIRGDSIGTGSIAMRREAGDKRRRRAKQQEVERRYRNSEESKMLNVTSVLISLAPLWAVLLVASSAATYLVFWRKAIK
jgi:hypothetical protein